MSACVPCGPPQASLVFFKGTQGDPGPAGPASSVAGPTGATGAAGPVVSYVGEYASTTTYYDNALRRDIVSYAGSFWVTSNTAKNNSSAWNVPNVSDWSLYGSDLVNVATALRLLYAANVNVGLNFISPGFLKSDNFVEGLSGWVLGGDVVGVSNGLFEAYNARIAGQISTNSPKFNVASVNKTMPAVAVATFSFGPIINADIPINPLLNNVTDDALIFFGWNRGANTFLSNRFGNATQVFDVSVKGIGVNSSDVNQFLYVQTYYRLRNSGGAWGAWVQFGQDALVQKILELVGIDQSFQIVNTLSVALIGTQDIQFSATFSKGSGGTPDVSVGAAANITVKAFN